MLSLKDFALISGRRDSDSCRVLHNEPCRLFKIRDPSINGASLRTLQTLLFYFWIVSFLEKATCGARVRWFVWMPFVHRWRKSFRFYTSVSNRVRGLADQQTTHHLQTTNIRPTKLERPTLQTDCQQSGRAQFTLLAHGDRVAKKFRRSLSFFDCLQQTNLPKQTDKLTVQREVGDRAGLEASGSRGNSSDENAVPHPPRSLCCLPQRRRRSPECVHNQHMSRHVMPSGTPVHNLSSAVHQTVEELMSMHLTDEQVLSVAMRPNHSPNNTFRRMFQTGLLQVILPPRHPTYLTGIHNFFFVCNYEHCFFRGVCESTRFL